MLIVKAFINDRQIEEIHIQNKGLLSITDKDIIHKYKIVKPKGHEDKIILHMRETGWKALTETALRIINERGGDD